MNPTRLLSIIISSSLLLACSESIDTSAASLPVEQKTSSDVQIAKKIERPNVSTQVTEAKTIKPTPLKVTETLASSNVKTVVAKQKEQMLPADSPR